MLFRLILPLLALLLLVSRADAQDGEVVPPPALFENATDSSAVAKSFSTGYLDASTIMMGRSPGTQVRIWRQASEHAKENMFVPELMLRHFGVKTETIDADTLTAPEQAYFAGYNAAVERILERDYGADVFDKIRQESRAQFRLYSRETSAGSENEND